jgi:hypothetical protein
MVALREFLHRHHVISFLSNKGEDPTGGEANLRISTELTPYQTSSSFTLYCNPLDFGCS